MQKGAEVSPRLEHCVARLFPVIDLRFLQVVGVIHVHGLPLGVAFSGTGCA